MELPKMRLKQPVSRYPSDVLAGVISRTATAHRAGETSRIARRLAWPAVTVVGAIVLFCCALREGRFMIPQSDGDGMVLQANAMLHGNLMLHGWATSDVSFYTTELPEYMLVELVRGMRPDVVPIGAALTYTLLVLLAAFAARGAARGRTGIARVAITVAIMLGPSLIAATVLLNDPDHVGTAVPVLAVFALIDRAGPGRRRYVPVAVGIVLALAVVADQLVLLIGVLPVALVYGTRACQLLIQRRAPLETAWYEVSLAVAAVLAVGGASVITHLIRAVGGFQVQRGTHSFVLESTFQGNMWPTFENFLGLYSADFFGQKFGFSLIFAAIHLVAAALVVFALWLALRRFLRSVDLLPALLAVAICANVLAYAVTFQVTGPTIREISPVFSLGAALAGRVLAGPLLRNRLEPLLLAGAAGALVAMVQPVLLVGPPAQPYGTGLASWLEQHHLSQGVAGYWQSDSVTLDSAGAVTVRAVREYPRSGLKPYLWESDMGLFNSQSYDVNFVVATAPGSQAGSTVTQREAIARFGAPYAVYQYKQFMIMVWHKNLLPELNRR
jgi:hypothetical protein